MGDNCNHFWRAISGTQSQCRKCGECISEPDERAARITALESALSDCVRHMTHAGSPDGLVAQVNGQRALEGKKPRKPEAIIREARR